MPRRHGDTEDITDNTSVGWKRQKGDAGATGRSPLHARALNHL